MFAVFRATSNVSAILTQRHHTCSLSQKLKIALRRAILSSDRFFLCASARAASFSALSSISICTLRRKSATCCSLRRHVKHVRGIWQRLGRSANENNIPLNLTHFTKFLCVLRLYGKVVATARKRRGRAGLRTTPIPLRRDRGLT